MNDKIKELAIQAGGVWRPGYVENSNGEWAWEEKCYIDQAELDLNKFANLIIKECIYGIEFGMDYTSYSSTEHSQIELEAQRWCRQIIKDIFGIK